MNAGKYIFVFEKSFLVIPVSFALLIHPLILTFLLAVAFIKQGDLGLAGICAALSLGCVYLADIEGIKWERK